MPKIILSDFSTKDFNQIVDDFLFNDKEVALLDGSLVPLRERLVKLGIPFQKIFQIYFEEKGNERYNKLIVGMEDFVKNLDTDNGILEGEAKKAFGQFWQRIGKDIENDTVGFQDSYLNNSCTYFTWELTKLSKQTL
jgi:hypothetical protein